MEKNIDSLIYFGANAYAEMISFDKVEFKGKSIYQKRVIEEIANDPELLMNLSTPNLVLVFSELYGEEQRDKLDFINAIFNERLKKGENLFSGSNIEKSNFIGVSFAWKKLYNSNYGLSKENLDILTNRIQSDYDAFKENNLKFCQNVLVHCATYDSIGNFLHYYKLGIITQEKMSFLEELVQDNPNLMKGLDFGILQDAIFAMDKRILTHIIRYPNLSAKLLLIYNNDRALFKYFMESVDKILLMDTKSEMFEKIAKLITYYALNVGQIKAEDMDDELIECALYNETNKNDKYYHSPHEYKKRNNYYNLNINNASETDLLDIISCKYFSINYQQLIKFVDSYGQDETILNSNPALATFIAKARHLINTQNIEELRRLYNSFDYTVKPSEIIKFESEFREAYAKTYVIDMRATYKQIMENIQLEDGVMICELTGDFSIPVHSADSGFKESKKLVNNSFVDTWKHRADVSDHLISTAYINQDFLGAVSVGNKGVLYGFLKTPADEINLIGISDINSHVRTSYYAAAEDVHYSSKEISKHSRRVYTEIALERVGVSPDCLVLFEDMSEEVKANSFAAAREFGIPIVKINKKNLVQRQLNKIDTLIREFNETNNIDVLCDLINLYETNLAGWLLNKDEANPIVQKGFAKYVNEDGTDANPDRTAEINHTHFAPLFLERGIKINSAIMTMIEAAKTNPQIMEVVKKMTKIISAMEKEMQLYQKVNESGVPITHTKFSFDGESIIKSAQEVLTYLPSAPADLIKPRMSINEMVNASINGENFIKKEDLTLAEEQLKYAMNGGTKNV